jgi:hypothetical protein
VVRAVLPRQRFSRAQLLAWLLDTQRRNERAKQSHQRRRAAPLMARLNPAASARAA